MCLVTIGTAGLDQRIRSREIQANFSRAGWGGEEMCGSVGVEDGGVDGA